MDKKTLKHHYVLAKLTQRNKKKKSEIRICVNLVDENLKIKYVCGPEPPKTES